MQVILTSNYHSLAALSPIMNSLVGFASAGAFFAIDYWLFIMFMCLWFQWYSSTDDGSLAVLISINHDALYWEWWMALVMMRRIFTIDLIWLVHMMVLNNYGRISQISSEADLQEKAQQ